tara:strand:+ start:172 stop:1761 length:1590 start_codon:yes stop_codon:yes gene_type:complete
MTTLAEKFKLLDSLRWNKLERSRYCSSLTIPSLLPPEGYNEQQQLPQPFSSVASRGVTSMASRMLSALLPLNDMPFFRFELASGEEGEFEIEQYLEKLSYQVYSKLSSGNLRETIYQALQHLIVVGDVMLIMEDDMNFRIIRLDRYVCRRDVYGEIEEVVYVEYESLDMDQMDIQAATSSMNSMENKSGYKEIYNCVKKKEDKWVVYSEDSDGNQVNSGEYLVKPFIFLRWSGIPGENYGRSHCEDMIGDIKSLEGFTEGMINGIAASSLFWMGVDPTGITEIDDIAGSQSGGFVNSRANEVFTISPAATMNPQIQATQQGVQVLRQEVGKAFLMDSASMPRGERVTATAVRMIGQELENTLGGAFSSIARDLMVPIVSRAVFVMITAGEVDERLKEMFTSDQGVLNVSIVTGLQALSRDSDLQKLMQMGEMIRNLPEPAAAMFKWDEYGKALITSLGFASDKWIKSEEEVKAEQMRMVQAQTEIQGQAQQQQMVGQAITQGTLQAAMQDMEQTGGANVQQAIQEIQGG